MSDLVDASGQPLNGELGPNVAVGDVFGKWQVIRLYLDEGVPMAEIVNTKNRAVRNREPVSALPSLKGTA